MVELQDMCLFHFLEELTHWPNNINQVVANLDCLTQNEAGQLLLGLGDHTGAVDSNYLFIDGAFLSNFGRARFSVNHACTRFT